MSGTTPRFGLNWFDGDSQPGSLSDDGQKYTGDDRLLLDRLLAAIENHDHSDPDSTDPSPTPEPVGLSLTSGSGALEAGKTYFYRVSFVDRQGTETPASDEASIDTPDRLTAPAAPSATTDPGGTLPAGLYFYALTAVRGIEETPLGEPVSVTVLVGEGQVTLTPPSLGDATAFYVWRMNDADGQWARFPSTISFGDFVDDGSVTPTPRSAPSTNTGVSNYSVSVTLDTPDQTTVQNFAGWKIYRTETSGTYGGNSLVEKVTTRTVESDPTSPLVTSFTDAGDALLPGSPPPINQGTKMRFVKQRLAIVTELPTDLSAYPQGFPLILVDGSTLKFYVLHGTSWELAGGGGSGAFPISAILPDPTTFEAGSPYVLVDGYGLHLYLTNGYAWTQVGGGSPTLIIGGSFPSTSSYPEGTPFVLDDGTSLSLWILRSSSWMPLSGAAGPTGPGPILASSTWVGPRGTAYSTVTISSGLGIWVPITFERAVTLASMGIEITTDNVGNSCNLAIFNEGANTGKPGTLLQNWGAIPMNAIGWAEVAGTLSVSAARYWLFIGSFTGSAFVRSVTNPLVNLGNPSSSPESTTIYAGYALSGMSAVPSDASSLSLVLTDISPSIRVKVS